MKEVVVIRSYLYRKGNGVSLDGLLRDNREATDRHGTCKILWWFDCPDQAEMDIEKATERTHDAEATMLRDAIRFQFEPLPNIKADHFDTSVLYTHWNFDGNQVFSPFLDQFVAITKQKTDLDEWFGAADFYGLFQVDTEEFRADDGGLDSIQIYVEFLGELDMDNLPITEESQRMREQLLARLGKDDDPPHYFY